MAAIAHPYHDGFYVGERGITHYRDGITRILGVGSCIPQGELGPRIALAFLQIALALKVGKVREEDGHFIFVRPYGAPICRYIGAVKPVGREFERHRIFVVIIAIVATQSDEHREISIPNGIHSILYALGMCKELQLFISAKIQACIAVHGTCIPGSEISDFQAQRLLILLRSLRLCGVDTAQYAGRKHIVNRLTVSIFFDINSADFHCRFSGRQ